MAKKHTAAIVIATCGLFMLNMYVPNVFAQENLEQQISQLEQQLADELANANQKYQTIEQLSNEISGLESQQNLLYQEITNQQKRVEERKESVKQRLQALQVSNYTYNRLAQILQADSLTEFFNRLKTIGDLFHADQQTIQNYKREVDILEQAQKTLQTQKEQLVQYQDNLQTESTQYNRAIQSLQQLIRENQQQLTVVKEQQVVTIQPETSVSSGNVAQISTVMIPEVVVATTQEQVVVEPVTPVADTITSEGTLPVINGNSSRTLEAEATAYSYTQPGLSFYTATGIDLRQNSQVIAVDPSVIPLGTLVEVPGYGVAIAGDTGGDIKGNRIDIHYNTVQEVTAFGRRNLTIKVFQ